MEHNDIYLTLAIITGVIFFYSLVAARMERSIISGPMIFVSVGIVFGIHGLGLLGTTATSGDLRLLADLTLALILFADAANANLSVLKQHFKIPSRMLLVGLPGAIVFGTVAAAVIFDQFSLYEAAILATMLAATDAALGKAVISNKSVPARVREGLNVESGFNDGLCVPILLVLLALASSELQGVSASQALLIIAEELGIGLVVGLSFAALGALLFRTCWQRGWVSEIWLQATVGALAISSFAVAQSLHGSGYIAAFSGGLLFGAFAKVHTHKLLLATEGGAELLALATWVLFGAAVIGTNMDLFSWQVVIYAVLSLTVIRILPIVLSLIGTDVSISERLFLGWFGPRGLASIVFVIIVINSELPGARLMGLVVTITVLMSLVLHGITAKPLAKWLGNKSLDR